MERELVGHGKISYGYDGGIVEKLKESVKKWQRVLLLISQKKNPKGGFIHEFWNSCGFCDVFRYCSKCPLHVGLKGEVYCFGAGNKDVIAYKALFEAEHGDFKVAQELCIKFIDFMKKTIEKEGIC